MSIRFTRATSTTSEQRRDALISGLNNIGDCVLVWVNEHDLKEATLHGNMTEIKRDDEERNLLPEFHQLLGEAHSACETSDMFDLHSEDKESVETWNKLKEEDSKAKAALVNFIRDHPTLLPQILSLTR